MSPPHFTFSSQEGWVSVGRFLSLRLHIIGLGENPTCTNPSNLQIFINPNRFRDTMTKICYILRGLPGTGKSMLAMTLRNGVVALPNGYGGIFSTDSYFMVDGEYLFDPKLLHKYHLRNLEEATAFMERCSDMERAVCVIDNTNTQHWEYEGYVEAAKANDFLVQVISIDWDAMDIPLYAERNSHGVPEEAIYRMAARWEY